MELIRGVYNRFVRPYLPRKFTVYNGVAVKNIKLFDATDEYPDYEGPLLDAIRSKVSRSDDVLIVGGGLGVSTVVAVNGSVDGSVTTYEASKKRYELANETLQTAKVGDNVNLKHALVGDDVGVVGEKVAKETIAPEKLNDCDILVLGCEGAELQILEGLSYYPETIVVETHEFLDSPEEVVREHLNEAGYEVVERGTEVEELGVFVLTAIRNYEGSK